MNALSSRRQFLASLGAFVASSTVISPFAFPRRAQRPPVPRLQSPFRVSVITDEISQDFGHACEIAANEFGMSWVELRGLWNKNIVALDAKEISEAVRILEKFDLRVTDIASPLFKVDWPGAPKSKFSPAGAQFHADFTFDQQGEVLDRGIALAKSFHTDRIRCFDFWRLDNPAPHRAAINQKLLDAATKAGKQEIVLVLENEPACSTATGAEAATVLAAVKSPHLLLNWDPGNAATLGERPYPDGYNLLPKERIGHCHCKDAIRKPDGSGYDWAPVGRGIIDWVGQFRALERDGYRLAVSLETHWRGAATPEESTRQSWAGMKAALQQATKS
jgi:L-ribulose-5-phosphate 3-epimerase